MSIAELFIKRPVMTTLIMTAILVFGVMGYRALPVSDLPSVDFPTIQVNANLPGATPDTMASAIATVLERQFSTIAGIDSMSSTSGVGRTQITIQFALDRDIDAAAQDVQAAIAKAGRQLPPEMPTPPTYQKVNPADQPIFLLSLMSPTLPLSSVSEYGDTFIAQRISMLPGVAQVVVYGQQKFAVRVQLDPRALASRGIGINEAASAVARANVNLPTGILYGPHQAVTVLATGQLMNADAYKPVIVAYRNGNPVRVEEIGRVVNSVENDKVAAWYRDTRSVVLAVQRQPGTNTIEVVDSIKNLLPIIRAQIPPSIQLETLYDRAETIRESINDVKFTLLLTVGLVVLVIFLFLRNLPATIIPSLALPMSIVGTFAAMKLLGFSLDNLSLMALTLSVGFVVDDAIVMLENIVRRVEGGEDVLTASLNGSREIGFTILSMTLSLVAVFIPVLFMGGILGRLLHEFAVTIGIAILVSGLVSLTLTPMLCSRFLKPVREQHHGLFYRALERVFEGMRSFYDVTLRVVLRHRGFTMLVSLFLLAATAYLFAVTPKGFIPDEDTNQILAATEGPQGISFDSMRHHQQAVAALVMKDPDVAAFMSSMGASGPGGLPNQGRLFIRLKPRPERKASVDKVMDRLRRSVSRVPGIATYFRNPPIISIGGRVTKSLYQFTLQSPDTEELYRYAPELEAKIHALPYLQDVTSDLQMQNPQVTIEILRDRASVLGVTAEQIEDALYSAYGSRQISTIYAPTNQYQVIMELEPQWQADPSVLPLLYVRAQGGQLVPLDTLARITPSLGPLSINHSGQLPAVTISFNLRPEVSLGQAVSEVEQIARRTLPATISMSFQGTAQAFQASMQGLWLLLAMSIFVIYMVLGILYESFVHPITILSGLPSAGLGALLALKIFGTDLNMYSFVGIIMLVGIVKKNAIMMIDFALDAQRSEGRAPEDAIYHGALIRFRPIMMTTMSALMGTLPIALGLGAGAESRRPLGLAVVGGLVVSQLLTLYITPVYFIYLEQFKNWVTRKKA